MNKKIVAYEVLRVIGSKPLFAKDHYRRLLNSVQSVDQNLHLSEHGFFKHILLTVSKYKIVNGNIKAEAVIDLQTKSINLSCTHILHHYPSSDDYKNGVDVITYKYVRENPNSKIWNQTLREITDNIIASENVYEVIYQNENDCLTEGSRSNLFFINENDLISAPESDILKGITRKYIISTAGSLGLRLIERSIHIEEIKNFQSAFISGTSPMILPVKKINSVEFDVNNILLRKLMSDFGMIVDDNIRNFEF